MDMTKIFYNTYSIPPDLLEKVQTSNLKADLCKECASLAKEFSEQFRQLEKIQMEITFCMSLIHRKFSKTDLKGETDKAENLIGDNIHSMGASEDNDSRVNAKLEIFDVLRNEARQKCQLKLCSIRPRVKIQNLTPKEIRQERFKIHQSSSQRNLTHHHRNSKIQIVSDPDPDIQIENVKIEQVPLNSVLDDYNDEDEDSPDNDLEVDSISDISDGNDFKSPDVTSASGSLKNKNAHILQSSCKIYRQTCNFCDKKFANSTDLDSHMEAVHLPISRDEVVYLSWDELNSRLAKYDLPESQLGAIHDIRRRAKNKISVRNTRKRQLDKLRKLADDVTKIREKKSSLITEREGLLARRADLSERYNLLDKFIFEALQGRQQQSP